MDDFGARLKAERERLGLTQAAFAEACGVGKTAQYTYERGEREPNWSYMRAAEALGVDALFIFSGTRKGEDWAYARAYKRVLLTVEMLLGLDESRLNTLVQAAIQNEAKIEAGDAVVDIGPYNESVLSWLRTSSRPDQLIDLELLAAIIQRIDVAKGKHPSLTAAKQAQAISALYRAFKASGKLDDALISEAVALAST